MNSSYLAGVTTAFVLQGEIVELQNKIAVLSLVTICDSSEKQDVKFLCVPLGRKTILKAKHRDLIRIVIKGTTYEVLLSDMRVCSLSQIAKHLYRLDNKGLLELRYRLSILYQLTKPIQLAASYQEAMEKMGVEVPIVECGANPVVFNVAINDKTSSTRFVITSGETAELESVSYDILETFGLETPRKSNVSSNIKYDKDQFDPQGIRAAVDERKKAKPEVTNATENREVVVAPKEAIEERKRVEPVAEDFIDDKEPTEEELITDSYVTGEESVHVHEPKEPSLADLAAIEAEMQGKKRATVEAKPFVKPVPKKPSDSVQSSNLVSALLDGDGHERSILPGYVVKTEPATSSDKQSDGIEIEQTPKPAVSESKPPSLMEELLNPAPETKEEVVEDETTEETVESEAIEEPVESETVEETTESEPVEETAESEPAEVPAEEQNNETSSHPVDITSIAEELGVTEAVEAVELTEQERVAIPRISGKPEEWKFEEVDKAYMAGRYNHLPPISLAGKTVAMKPDVLFDVLLAYIAYYHMSRADWAKKYSVSTSAYAPKKHKSMYDWLTAYGVKVPDLKSKTYKVSEYLKRMRDHEFDNVRPIVLSGHLSTLESQVEDVLIAYVRAELYEKRMQWGRCYGLSQCPDLKIQAIENWLKANGVIFDTEVNFGWVK